MKTLILEILFLLSVFASGQISNVPGDTAKAIDKLMQTLHERGQYNGSIIVAVNGKIIYRSGFGESNFETHKKFSPETISCLASVSKQFTAMTIMMLAEQNKIRYDDLLSKYIPELTKYADDVTIRNLLTHTSGIPDVGDLGIDHPGLTNNEVLRALIKQESLVFKPGTRYQYSNTGYVLLSIIVERITKKSFKDYLTEKILVPLKMSKTFLYDGSQSRSGDVASGYNQFGLKDDFNSLETGDGGMFSTVDDLLKWDRALYTERLVKQSTLDTAFTPAKVTEGTTTYGFGWNINGTRENKTVWHTGNTAGFRAFIERVLKDKIAIIMLTNKGNSKRMEISNAILNILKGLPYQFPKRPVSEKMYSMINEYGVDSAIKTYDSLRAADDTTYDFSESELNTLGYQLLSDNKKNEGVQILKLNTVRYPNSSNAFDSLGDAYSAIRDKDSAMASYQKAVDLDKNNIQSRDKLNRLKNLK
jgi:CubicO group peptidase (beta-lactamase class C family)